MAPEDYKRYPDETDSEADADIDSRSEGHEGYAPEESGQTPADDTQASHPLEPEPDSPENADRYIGTEETQDAQEQASEDYSEEPAAAVTAALPVVGSAAASTTSGSNQQSSAYQRHHKLRKHPMHYTKTEAQKLKHASHDPEHAHDAHAHNERIHPHSQPKVHEKAEKTAEKREAKQENKEWQKSKYTGIIGAIENFYISKYKELLIFTVLLILISLSITITHTIRTGDFVDKGVTLKGGITVTINVPTGTNVDITGLETALKDRFPTSDLSVRDLSQGGVQKGVVIESNDIPTDQVEAVISDQLHWITKGDYSVEMTGSSLGAAFFNQTLMIVLIAVICMGLVVFAYFRIPVPSVAIMLAAISTIITTLGIVNLIHLKLSTAGVAAFLMLLGYSIDTDILLSVRILKRKEGTVYDRTIDAMKTGLTMTITALAATIIALIFTQSEVIHQIMLILTIGLVCDIIYTWIQNVAILRWYLEKHGHRHNVHDGTFGKN